MSRFEPLRSRISDQQMFFARKRSANVAAAEGFVCVKAQRQQKGFICAKAKRQQQQQDVGNEGVITGRDGFSLRSSIADPRGVAQSPLRSSSTFSNKPVFQHFTIYDGI